MFYQGGHVVSIDRADVAHSKFFEERRGDHHALPAPFGLSPDLYELLASRDLVEEASDVVVESVVDGIGYEFIEVI